MNDSKEDLVVNGNRAVVNNDYERFSPLMISQASVNFDWHQKNPTAPANPSLFNSTDQQFQSPEKKVRMQLSNDTSRSPIPIDPELLK